MGVLPRTPPGLWLVFKQGNGCVVNLLSAKLRTAGRVLFPGQQGDGDVVAFKVDLTVSVRCTSGSARRSPGPVHTLLAPHPQAHGTLRLASQPAAAICRAGSWCGRRGFRRGAGTGGALAAPQAVLCRARPSTCSLPSPPLSAPSLSPPPSPPHFHQDEEYWVRKTVSGLTKHAFKLRS